MLIRVQRGSERTAESIVPASRITHVVANLGVLTVEVV